MTITNGYATLAELKARLGISDTTEDTILEAVIEAASRWIDEVTGKRFYAATETRYYTAEWGDYLEIDDLLSVTTLKTDEDGDRVYETTWAATDYDLEPINRTPKSIIRTTPNGTRAFPTLRKGIEIAGSWGYSSTTPDLVNEACLLQAGFLYSMKQAPLGKLGSTEIGEIVSVGKVHPTAKAMLRRWMDESVSIGGI